MSLFVRKHKKKFFLGAGLASCLLLFVFVAPAWAGPFDTTTQPDANREAGNTIASIFSWIFSLIAWCLIQLVVLVIDVLITVTKYNNFAQADVVRLGWPILRDLSNMFFIVILLITAISTILGVEEYQYKKMLPKILLMAVFINFSKMITGVLIDVSQIITLTFVSAFADTAAGNFVSAGKLTKLLNYRGPSGEAMGYADAIFASVAAGFLACLMLFAYLLTLIAVLIVFLVRILMLWILTVLSPLPYLLSILPGGESRAHEWWETLGKYLFIGPTLAFFLWLTMSLIAVTNGDLGTQVGQSRTVVSESGSSISSGSIGQNATGAAVSGEVGSILSGVGTSSQLLGYIMVLALLFLALEMAQKSGVMGAQVAGKMAHGIEKVGLGTALLGPKLALTYLNRKRQEFAAMPHGRFTGGISSLLLAPDALIKAFKKRSEGLTHHAGEKAEAKGAEVIEGIFTAGAIRMPKVQVVERAGEQKFAKDFSAMEKDEKGVAAARMIKPSWAKGQIRDDEETRAARRGIVIAAAQEGHIDDLMSNIKIQDAMKKDLSKTLSPEEMEKYFDEDGNLEHNFGSMRAFIKWYMGNDPEAARVAYDVGEIGKKIPHKEYSGMASVDSHGHYHFTDTDRENQVEISKFNARSLMPDAPHQFLPFMLQGAKSGFATVMDGTAFKTVKLAFSGMETREKTLAQKRLGNMLFGGTMEHSSVDKHDGYAKGMKKVDKMRNGKLVRDKKTNEVEKEWVTGDGLDIMATQRIGQAITQDDTADKNFTNFLYKQSGGKKGTIALQFGSNVINGLFGNVEELRGKIEGIKKNIRDEAVKAGKKLKDIEGKEFKDGEGLEVVEVDVLDGSGKATGKKETRLNVDGDEAFEKLFMDDEVTLNKLNTAKDKDGNKIKGARVLDEEAQIIPERLREVVIPSEEATEPPPTEPPPTEPPPTEPPPTEPPPTATPPADVEAHLPENWADPLREQIRKFGNSITPKERDNFSRVGNPSVIGGGLSGDQNKQLYYALRELAKGLRTRRDPREPFETMRVEIISQVNNLPANATSPEGIRAAAQLVRNISNRNLNTRP